MPRFLKCRPLGLAARVGVRAARMEGTTRGRVERVGHLALHGRSRAARVVHLRDRIEQHARVRMARVAEQLVLARELHQPAEVHHADLVAHVPHHRQVVRDEQVREAALALQVLHDVEHLRLHAHVQRRGGLVADQEFRLGGQCPRDRDTLPLPAGELVRELLAVLRRQPHRLQQLGHLVLELRFVGDDPVLLERLGHDVLHRPARVQAGVRVLEDHLDAPAQLAPLRRLERGMRIVAVEGEPAARGLVQPHQQPRHRALAAARFADERQRLALGDVEAHAVDGVQQLTRPVLEHAVEPRHRDVEGLGEIPGLDQRRVHAAALVCASCSQHAARVAPASSRSGRSLTQRSNTRGQRGL